MNDMKMTARNPYAGKNKQILGGMMLVGAVILVVSTVVLAQSPPPDADLKKAVEAREAALAAGDADTWGRLTTDAFLRIEVDGVVTTKPQRMAQLKANRCDRANVVSISGGCTGRPLSRRGDNRDRVR